MIKLAPSKPQLELVHKENSNLHKWIANGHSQVAHLAVDAERTQSTLKVKMMQHELWKVQISADRRLEAFKIKTQWF